MVKSVVLFLALAGLCSGDIVLSVAPPQNMEAYLGVLSRAWNRVYPQLEAQLETAREQVPAEYRHMMQILGITGVPSEYDEGWARGFVDNARRIGPTTIYAKDIEGAAVDLGPTDVVTTDGNGLVATITNAPLERPTIYVAVNGNAVRAGHEPFKSSSGEGGVSSSGEDSTSEEKEEEEPSSSSGAADSLLKIPAIGAAMAFALASAAATSFF
ncbi:hypothetical protein IWW37_003213 [Coemansia sp. RSA 2050]|nr:hypothetical protein IWW37_003213 [Coemansia sp. RSA 2050]KAJ2733125.1 hypothetical protein IW152_003282 [Coemansia sp. BCRC 34962]